ncbi:DUF3885 domain-containing protein [Domibacillus robiginosus]|uniref:DUF3885 domain-containing protein n=1 Tax=Domibacillus robiginosus TaxID=1071054 RepID=UPI00067AB1AB|nr:DUF3885 domain-containing protein [Domibacillus robiginosus]
MFDKTYRELFGGLPLEKPFFYHAPAALRFELGKPGSFGAPNYMNRVYERSFTLFEEIFQPHEEIWMVVYKHRLGSRHKRTSVFRTYVHKPAWSVIEGGLWREEDGAKTDRLIGKGQVRHMRYRHLIRALSHVDVGLKPAVAEECFFIHPIKRIVYHLYDDRGLDIAAASAHSLRPLYNKYNGWLLDYDREAMDRLFR